jgi:hypothetical protein
MLAILDNPSILDNPATMPIAKIVFKPNRGFEPSTRCSNLVVLTTQPQRASETNILFS